MTQYRKNELDDQPIPQAEIPQWLDDAVNAYFDDEGEIPSPSEIPQHPDRLVQLGLSAAQSSHALCRLRKSVAGRLDSARTLDEVLEEAAREEGIDLAVVRRWLCPRDPRPEAISIALRDPERFARLAIALEIALPSALRLMKAAVRVPVSVSTHDAAQATEAPWSFHPVSALRAEPSDEGRSTVHFGEDGEAILRACYREDQELY